MVSLREYCNGEAPEGGMVSLNADEVSLIHTDAYTGIEYYRIKFYGREDWTEKFTYARGNSGYLYGHDHKGVIDFNRQSVFYLGVSERAKVKGRP